MILAGDYFEDIHLLQEPVNKEDLINTIIRDIIVLILLFHLPRKRNNNDKMPVFKRM